jgi:hypothetical protein
MRALIADALALGWSLHAYEDESGFAIYDALSRQDAINWREDQQARNLGAVVDRLPEDARIFVWCGGGHLLREPYVVELEPGEPKPWIPMGSLVEGYCGVEAFAIDQTVTVAWGGNERDWLDRHTESLRQLGGTAGFLAGDEPEAFEQNLFGQVADAYVLSLDNALTEETGERA